MGCRDRFNGRSRTCDRYPIFGDGDWRTIRGIKRRAKCVWSHLGNLHFADGTVGEFNPTRGPAGIEIVNLKVLAAQAAFVALRDDFSLGFRSARCELEGQAERRGNSYRASR